MATLTNRRMRSAQGQAVIEMALTLPLLLAIIFGIFDFGFMFQRYEVVTNAAREAARLGVLRESGGYTARRSRTACARLPGCERSRRGWNSSKRALHARRSCQFDGASDVTGGTVDLGGTPPLIVNEVTVVVQYDHEHVFVGPSCDSSADRWGR